jgi:hypothetical protein
MPCWKKAQEERHRELIAKYDTGYSHDVSLREPILSKTIYDLLLACEVHCLIDCCGFNALDITRERVRAWLDHLDSDELQSFWTEFSHLIEIVDSSPSPLRVIGDELTVADFHREVSEIERLFPNDTLE